MKQLEYPFHAEEILSTKRKIKKELLASGNSFTEKNIAILGGSTIGEIKSMLELFLLNQGIRPHFYEAEYNRYYEEAVFPNERLKKFRPDMIYIHTTNRNVDRYPAMTDSREMIDSLLQGEMEKFERIWSRLTEAYHCPVIQNNFEMPLYRLLGNKDASDIHGRVNFLTRLNMKFYEYAQTHRDFFICDINYISADYGLKEWADPFYFYLYKYALNIKAIPYLALNVSNMIKSVFGKNKKGFVLDLDHTLWGGVIGEDGAEQILLGREEPAGQAYLEFQKYIKAHKQLGILLNVDSKNEYENAIAGLRHGDSELKPEDFIQIKANWKSKDENFSDIADSLNLLPESLVFIDDNPAERHIITEQFPGAAAPEIGESHQYIQNIDRNGFFEATVVSKDDGRRGEMYLENARRAQFRGGFADYGEYLISLDMRAEIRSFETAYTARISQLTNKSSQFNLTTKRYTQSELEAIMSDEGFITLYGKLKDRFGDNGIVSIVIGRVTGKVCDIDLWLMSCRVLKREMETAMMDVLLQQCQERGVEEIRGYYHPTAKNSMVKEFYGTQGFVKAAEDCTGNTEWVYESVSSYKKRNKFIKVE